MNRVTDCLDARVEPAARIKLAVLQELDFGASKLTVVAELTGDLPPISLQRP
jgi:hypothetical protein